jgi:hypothetical protein
MRVVAGLSFPSCSATVPRGESSARLAMESSRQWMGGVRRNRWEFGRRRLDLAVEAAQWLVERLGGRSASATSSFPLLVAWAARSARRAVQGSQFWPCKRLDSAALVGGGGGEWWSVWGRPRRPDGLGCYPLPTPPLLPTSNNDGGMVVTLGSNEMGGGYNAEGRGA